MKFAFKIIRLLAAVALLVVGLARCARAQISADDDDRRSECSYLLEPKMSAKAWRELDEIVELSERVKAGSQTLVKHGR